MAAVRVSYLVLIMLVALALETARGANKREAKDKVKENAKIKDFLEGQEVNRKPPPNASPLEICILLLEIRMSNLYVFTDNCSV